MFLSSTGGASKAAHVFWMVVVVAPQARISCVGRDTGRCSPSDIFWCGVDVRAGAYRAYKDMTRFLEDLGFLRCR